jgi:5-methylcytosine-specific restriction endonuclease McrA
MGKIRAFGRHVRWSDEEVDLLKVNYSKVSRAQLIALFQNRDIRSVECKANSLGLSRPGRTKRSRSETLAAKRDGMARRRATNPEAVRAYQREFHRQNRERQTKKMREYAARRFFWNRANKLRGENAATYRDLARLWKAQRGLCALTGVALDRTAEVDHKIPKTRGGSDHISNLQWASSTANRAKRDLTTEEFALLCGDVMRWLGTRIAMAEQIGKANDPRHTSCALLATDMMEAAQ